MSFIRRLEEAAAKKLKKLFLGAQKYADTAVDDLQRIEKELTVAKERAAEATDKAYKAAAEAAEKAQTVANQLMIEARAAEERAREYHEILIKHKETK